MNFFERRRRGPTPTSLQFLDGADEGHRLRAISRSWQNLVKVSIQLVRVELQNAAQLGAGISSDEPDVSLGRTDDQKKAGRREDGVLASFSLEVASGRSGLSSTT